MTTPDVPAWLKVIGALGVAASWIWTIVVHVVRPWNDERWFRAFERNSLRIEHCLRAKMLKTDYERADRIDQRIEAMDDALKAIAAAQLAQGKALEDIPPMSRVMERLDVTITATNTAMTELADKVSTLATGHHEMRGMMEAWRDEQRRRGNQ